MDKKEIKYWLFLIFLISSFLRFFALNLWPSSINSHEALLGYRAFSLGTTGRDEFAQIHPLIFSSPIDYQLPVTTYLLIPFVKIFGLNEISIRLPFALIGTAIVFLVYLLSREIFKNEKTALWSSFFAAISPWGIFFSRFVSPQSLALFFFLCGLWLSFKKSWSLRIISIIFFVAGLYTDKISWFFLPPFLMIWFFWLNKRKIINFKNILLTLIIIFILWTPLVISYSQLSDFKRSLLLNDFSLFTDIGFTNWANALRGEDNYSENAVLSKFFHNRPVIYTTEITSRFFKHFTPRFLFSAGDANSLNGPSQQGPFLLITLVFIILGILTLGKNKNSNNLLLLLWFLIAAIPSVFVLKSPDLSRFIFALPAVVFILGVGAASLQGKPLIYFLSALILFNGLIVWYDAQIKEPARAYATWAEGYKKAVQETEKYKNPYNSVYISNSYGSDQPALFLFYLAYPPEKLWKDYPVEKVGFRPWISHFDKYSFGQFSSQIIQSKLNSLYLGTPEDFRNYSGGSMINLNNFFVHKQHILSLSIFPKEK